MGSFKRVTYGKVRPVPKQKEKPPARPEVHVLRGIFKYIQTSDSRLTLDHLSSALNWWPKALPYCAWRMRKLQPLSASKALLDAQKNLGLGQAAKGNTEKQKHFVLALGNYARYGAAAGLKVPDLAPFLKRSAEGHKKEKVVNKKLTVRFDPILTLLQQCFTSSQFTFEVREKIGTLKEGTQTEYKFDHELGKMYFSREYLTRIKSWLHKQGLLYVVLDVAWRLSRGMSFRPEGLVQGEFIEDTSRRLVAFADLLQDFEQFSHTTKAPKSLVKREKKVKVAGAKKGTFPKKKIVAHDFAAGLATT